MLILVDSSVFLSSLIKEEKHHLNSVNFFATLQKDSYKIIIPHIIFFEVLNKVAQLSPKTDLPLIYQSLAKSREIGLFYFDLEFNQFYLNNVHKFTLKTSDLLIALTAMYHKCPLISWDRQLLKQAAKRIKVYTPKQYCKK